MSIPNYQTLMLPLLQFTNDNKEHSLREVIDSLALKFQLTNEEKAELLPSRRQAVFDNRVGWARTYLKKAGLLESSRRAYIRITKRGTESLANNPARIDVKFLEQFPEFLEFRKLSIDTQGKSYEEPANQTPSEALESAYQQLQSSLANELLHTVKNSSSSFFEQIVVDLLSAMGYGGSKQEAGQRIGQTHDEGIDGIIKEDKLGLDIIYIQAKRWQDKVGRPELHKFAGALQGQRAHKGVFITTSSFTKEALDFVESISSKIILIDGSTLAKLMIEFNVGVLPMQNYEVKKVNLDYFLEE